MQGVEIRAGVQQLRCSPSGGLDPPATEAEAEVARLNALIVKHNRMAPVASVQMGQISLAKLREDA